MVIRLTMSDKIQVPLKNFSDYENMTAILNIDCLCSFLFCIQIQINLLGLPFCKSFFNFLYLQFSGHWMLNLRSVYLLVLFTE